MKSLLICFIFGVFTASLFAVEVRFRNATTKDFEKVVVNGVIEFGDIKHGEISPYQKAKSIWSNTGVEFIADSKKFRTMPPDHDGDHNYTEGRFTVVVNIISIATDGSEHIRVRLDAEDY